MVSKSNMFGQERLQAGRSDGDQTLAAQANEERAPSLRSAAQLLGWATTGSAIRDNRRKGQAKQSGIRQGQTASQN